MTTHPDPSVRAAVEVTVPEPATPKDLDGSGPTTEATRGSSPPEVSFEAQRQLMALAEALARQAAREDDAAECIAEPSCSPPDVPVEILPGRGAKEDTS